jgi:hypothetical protein
MAGEATDDDIPLLSEIKEHWLLVSFCPASTIIDNNPRAWATIVYVGQQPPYATIRAAIEGLVTVSLAHQTRDYAVAMVRDFAARLGQQAAVVTFPDMPWSPNQPFGIAIRDFQFLQSIARPSATLALRTLPLNSDWEDNWDFPPGFEKAQKGNRLGVARMCREYRDGKARGQNQATFSILAPRQSAVQTIQRSTDVSTIFQTAHLLATRYMASHRYKVIQSTPFPAFGPYSHGECIVCACCYDTVPIIAHALWLADSRCTETHEKAAPTDEHTIRVTLLARGVLQTHMMSLWPLAIKLMQK